VRIHDENLHHSSRRLGRVASVGSLGERPSC
jgi:hypothetical protein